jgi:multicomponent Na+:H+ antiporter subunit B
VIDPYRTTIIQFAARIQAPLLQLYALYVLFHGHYSPGGGFQAGAALAGSFLVPRLAEGVPAGVHGLTTRVATSLAVGGMALYGAVGVVSMLEPGTAFLDYDGLAGLPFGLQVGGQTRAIGSLLIEVGITLTVLGVLVTLFDDLVARERG